MSISSRLLVLVVVVGVVLSLVGIDLLLRMEGNALLGIPYPPEFLDRYWTELPAVGWTLTVAGSAMILASAAGMVVRSRKGPDGWKEEAKEFRIRKTGTQEFRSEDGQRVFKKGSTDGHDDELKSEDFGFVSKKAMHIATKHYEFEGGDKRYTDENDDTLLDAYDTQGKVVKKTAKTYVIEDGKKKYTDENERIYDGQSNTYTSKERLYDIGADGSIQSGDEPRASMKCTNCGTEVGIAVTNCPSCGVRLVSTL